MATISDADKKMLLSLSEDELTLNKLREFFANTKNKKAKFKPSDKFTLEKGEFMNNKEPMVTTVGRYILNKIVFEDISKRNNWCIPYQNYTFAGGSGIKKDKEFDDLDKMMVLLLNKELIDMDDFHDYLDRLGWLVYGLNSTLAGSLTASSYIIDPVVKKRKEELMKEHAKELEENDIFTATAIEGELLDLTKQSKIMEDPGMEIYKAGARGSYSNNYKNTVLMRGGIMDTMDSNKFYISKASLIDGIPIKDFDKYANVMVAAIYSRAKSTQDGGYIGKQMTYAFQGVTIDEEGTDCGTTKTLEVKLTKFLSKMMTYRYIVENGELVLLTPENIKKYIDKVVHLRSPMYCKSDKYCSKCAGELYELLGIENVGLMTNRKGTTLMNYALKKFHNSTIKTYDYDPFTCIEEIKD